LPNVILGWLLTWANCPDRGLSASQRADAAAARQAAAEGAGALSSATKQDLAQALDQALRQFPVLCPDVGEERRLRMAAMLARILEGDHAHIVLREGPAAAPDIR
jgi:hypothetical protein